VNYSQTIRLEDDGIASASRREIVSGPAPIRDQGTAWRLHSSPAERRGRIEDAPSSSGRISKHSAGIFCGRRRVNHRPSHFRDGIPPRGRDHLSRGEPPRAQKSAQKGCERFTRGRSLSAIFESLVSAETVGEARFSPSGLKSISLLFSPLISTNNFCVAPPLLPGRERGHGLEPRLVYS
jgi:hypothetical protein